MFGGSFGVVNKSCIVCKVEIQYCTLDTKFAV